MNKTIKILIVAVLALLIIAGIGKKLEWFGKHDLLAVESEKVELRTIVEKVSANGKIQPEVEVKISPDVSGEIIEFVDQEIENLQKKVAEKYGYELVDHRLELYGVKKKF